MYIPFRSSFVSCLSEGSSSPTSFDGGGSWHEGWGAVGERTAPSKHIPQRTAPLKAFFKRFVFVYFCLGNL